MQQCGGSYMATSNQFVTVSPYSSKLSVQNNDFAMPVSPSRPWRRNEYLVIQERTMARCRPMLSAEEAKALTLLMSPAADEFAIALDRCGWMIVQQPQFGDRRWFMNYPSDVCPEWADHVCLKSRRRPGHACGSSTAPRMMQRQTEPLRPSTRN